MRQVRQPRLSIGRYVTTQDKEILIQNFILDVMRNEAKNKKSKVMYCCRNITEKVAYRMTDVTNRQVWEVMKKLISNRIILYAVNEPPLIILAEHFEDLQKKYPEFAMSFNK
jgi:hypothetical protein